MEMIQIDWNYSAGNKSTAIFFSIFYFFFPFNFKVVNYNFFRLLFLFFFVCARATLGFRHPGGIPAETPAGNEKKKQLCMRKIIPEFNRK